MKVMKKKKKKKKRNIQLYVLAAGSWLKTFMIEDGREMPLCWVAPLGPVEILAFFKPRMSELSLRW